MEHNVITYTTDDGYQLECMCGWNYYASKASKTKMHPHREPDVFAKAVEERHYINCGVWPYTKHGKPEKHDGQEVIVLDEWPYNKE